MKKPLKVLSAATLASVFAATAIVPVAAQDIEAPKAVKDVIFVNDKEQNLTLDLKYYGAAYNSKVLKDEALKQLSYVVADNGKVYDLKQYGAAYNAANKDLTKAFELLKGKEVNIEKILPGKIEDGFVVADEQPEDRLNETFFYNVA